MGINFPASPAINDLYPTPAVPGVPQYKWDGTAWAATVQDPLQYVKRSGDTMAGLLKLSGNPVAGLDAAPRQYVDSSSFSAGMSNGVIVTSAAAGALTVAVKTVAGADPSVADPVYFYFHNNIGGFLRLAATAPLSLVIGASKLVGFTSGTAGRLWVTAHNNAGTVALGVIKCSDPNGFVCPSEWSMYATFVPGNQSRSFYTTTAIPGASWRFIGFCDWDNLVTAGTWTVPDRTFLFLPGMPKPGDIVQKQQIVSATPTSVGGTTWTTTALVLSIGLTSKCNLLELFASGTVSISGLTYGMTTIFKYATSSPIGSLAVSYAADAGTVGTNFNYALDFPNSNAAANYTVALQNNNNVASVMYPATGNAVFVAQEIMG